MPIYTYTCSECNKSWDDIQTLSNADKPIKEACPHCEACNCVKRESVYSTNMNADTTMTPDKATGGKWSAVMEKMRNAPGVRKKDRENLDRASSRTGRRWK